MTSQRIQRTYLGLTALNTLAASLIWGVNTLFLLDAGLSNAQAFAANAFFSLGMVLFEIPTGVVADTFGRQISYLCGTATLVLTTFGYLALWHFHGPFILWAFMSGLLGLGFTFFSGAVEAWLVDALDSVGFKGLTEDVFAKGQIATGIAMVIGATAGGFIAQESNLGVPYVIRCVILGFSFLAALIFMRDLGFEKRKITSLTGEMRSLLKSSVQNGLMNRPVRWMMLTGPLMAGVAYYGFYAAQPWLLEIYGDPKAFGVAGVAAAVVALSQVAGGLAVPYLRRIFRRRSSVVMFIIVGCTVFMCLAAASREFFWVIFFLSLWALLGAALMPIQRAYLNQLIASKERATILSFDGMLSSLGSAGLQPVFGRAADLWGYPSSLMVAGVVQIFALPFAFMVRRENNKADHTRTDTSNT